MAADVTGYFNVGKAIGEAVSRKRFDSKRAKIEEEFGVQGGNPADAAAFAPRRAEFEARIADAAQRSGMTRRGLTDDVEYLKQFREQEALNARRLIGQQNDPNNPGATYGAFAADSMGRGDIGGGMAAQQAGRDITRTMAAVGPDGRVDQGALVRGQTQGAAEKGDAEGVRGFAEKANGAAQALYGRAYSILGSGGKLGDLEQVLGFVREGMNLDTRWGTGLGVQSTADGKNVYLTRNGEAQGDPIPVEKLPEYLKMLTSDPDALLKGAIATDTKRASDTYEAGIDREKKIFEGVLKAVDGIPNLNMGDIDGMLKSRESLGRTKGWEFHGSPQVGADGSATQDLTINGRGMRMITPAPTPGNLKPVPQVMDLTTKKMLSPDEIDSIMGGDEVEQQVGGLIAGMNALTTGLASVNTDIAKTKIGMLQAFAPGGATASTARALFGNSGGGGSRAERNNNPGNIEDGEFAKGLPGYKGSDGRFAIFDSPEAGAAAAGKLLESYMGRGFNTVEKIVGRWSPQSDPTNQAGSTANYAKYVAQKIGKDPTAELTAADIPALQAAMAEFESGNTSGAPAAATAQAGALPPKGAPVAAATKAAATPSKPKATPLESQRADVGKGAKDLEAAIAASREAQAALAAFEKQYKPTESKRVEDPRVPAQQQTNLTPEQMAAWKQLQQQAVLTQRRMNELRGPLRNKKVALERSKTAEGGRKLAAQYRPGGGTAGSP